MKAAQDNLNPYAMVFEDGQTEIRKIILNAFYKREDKRVTREKLVKAINKATGAVKIPRLKEDGIRSLWQFAERQRKAIADMGISPEFVAFLAEQAEKGFPVTEQPPSSFMPPTYETQSVGVPRQEYYKDVWENRVRPTLDKLVNQVALDPNDPRSRNSLRNLAEMEVRYQGHQDNIEELRTAGEKLVVCSSHADCSGRCAKWQGRVYSLDGTYGTINGHKYVPLEKATDIYYTTKAGRVYKNGLLGFNCRHYLEPYREQLLPTISAEKRKAEYDITVKQRELEREVRRYKVETLYKETPKERNVYRAKARQAYERYIRFSKENHRAFYPMRTDI